MSKPILSGVRRLGASASIAAAVAALTAGSAMAAGTGYGSTSPTNSSPPAGFTPVVIAKTLGNKGGVVTGGGVGGEVTVTVPHGATGKSLVVAITHGSASTVERDVRGALHAYKVLATFGVELRHGSSPATAHRTVSVNFGAPDIHPGDVVLEYNAKTGKFARVTAKFSFSAGNFVVKIKSSESVALVGPEK